MELETLRTAQLREGERMAQEGFGIVLDTLEKYKERGLEYRIVGGTALASFMDGEYHAVRKNGTTRDVDVIVMNDPENVVSELRAELAEPRPGIMMPPVELSIIREERGVQTFQMLGTFRKTAEGGYTLTFRDISFPLSEEILKPVRGLFTLNGQKHSFDTFTPGTLLHLYIRRTASLKNKDVEKIKAFAKKMSRSGMFSFSKDHAPYKVFHDFAEAVRRKYPIYSAMVRSYNALDNALFNGLISHKLIPRKIWERIID